MPSRRTLQCHHVVFLLTPDDLLHREQGDGLGRILLCVGHLLPLVPPADRHLVLFPEALEILEQQKIEIQLL